MGKMIVILIFGIFSAFPAMAGASVLTEDGTDDGGGLLVMFWNLENFFDCNVSDGNSSDVEFSPGGERRWTKSRFWAKVHGVAKTVLWVGEEYGKYPDAIGFAEVENGYVVNMIAKATALKKLDYRCIHFDSPDSRGIDVAFLYRNSGFMIKGTSLHHVEKDADGKPMKTRDILRVTLSERTDTGRVWHFFTNHHPSKYGGVKISSPKRIAAMKILSDLCDSIAMAGGGHIVAMGDFNDTPDGEAFGVLTEKMSNAGDVLHEKGEGTIRYAGKWELIDMFLTDIFISDRAEMRICRPEFLLTRDSRHSGYRPFRTYIGPKYAGGLSDHLPIILMIR